MYLQVPLDEMSKQLVVINTQKGLFRYTRLPYGVSSAPGIFQRLMENVLQGIPNVIVYLDDILVMGPNYREHLKTLSLVLSLLESSGLRVLRLPSAQVKVQVSGTLCIIPWSHDR